MLQRARSLTTRTFLQGKYVNGKCGNVGKNKKNVLPRVPSATLEKLKTWIHIWRRQCVKIKIFDYNIYIFVRVFKAFCSIRSRVSNGETQDERYLEMITLGRKDIFVNNEDVVCRKAYNNRVVCYFT